MSRNGQTTSPTDRAARAALPAALAAVVAAIALTVGVAPAAASDTCPNNETVLPDTGGNPPYQCAEMHNSDTIKLSSWETDSWTSSPGVGYYNKAKCSYKSDSEVTITTADAGSGLGSYTATATNWDVDKHHHYAAGVLWATGNVDNEGYDDGCYKTDDYKDNTGAIENSILDLSIAVVERRPVDGDRRQGGHPDGHDLAVGCDRRRPAAGQRQPRRSGDDLERQGDDLVDADRDRHAVAAGRLQLRFGLGNGRRQARLLPLALEDLRLQRGAVIHLQRHRELRIVPGDAGDWDRPRRVAARAGGRDRGARRGGVFAGWDSSLAARPASCPLTLP